MHNRTPDDLPDFESPHERVVVREIVRVERNNRSEHIFNQLIIAAIVALVGAIWVLGNNVARLMEWKESTTMRLGAMQANIEQNSQALLREQEKTR